MSDEFNPLFPQEPGNAKDENSSQDAGGFSGAEKNASDSDSGPPSSPDTDPSPHKTEEDDFEIIFYATVDPSQGERTLSSDSTTDPWGEEEVRILLPAWSETTISSRTTAPPLVQREKSGRRSFWRSCLIGVIAAIIVFSLLGSSLISIFWFWNLRSDRVAEVAALLDTHSGQLEGDKGNNRQAHDDDGAGRQLPAQALAAVEREQINRLVFVNDNRQVETISPDGSDRRQLTSDARSYIFPAWSNDGRSIAAIGTSISGAGIYVMLDEAETDAIEEVHFSSDNSPFYLYWSPDGSQITFLANDRTLDSSLNVVDLGSDSDSRTIALGSPMYWNWATDSRQLLVHSGSGTDDSQLVMVDDFGQPQAPRVPAPGPFQAPGISASGRYWAYSQFQAGGTTWLVIDDRLSGSENSQRHAGSVALSWSPTRDELAFISGRAGEEFSAWGPLRLMDAESGDVRLLSSDTVLAFFWSPDGKKIATISVPEQNDFGEQYEVRNDKERRLARYAADRALQPVAQMGPPHTFRINVIDVESGEGLQLLDTSLSAVFLTQFIPYFDQYAFSHHIWSPDSNSLVLPLAEGRQSQITLVDVRNGRVTPLADGSIGFWSPH